MIGISENRYNIGKEDTMLDEEQRQELVGQTLDVAGSFLRAVDAAGGKISLEELNNKTVTWLFQVMALNGIRFIFWKEKIDGTTQ